MNVKLQFIKKEFKGQHLFDISNFEFKTGDIHGIIGPNGGGKTTLLRLIAGLDKDYSGNVYYDDLKQVEDLTKNITYISQSPYMLSRTVYENIAYPLRIRNVKEEEIDMRVNEFLEVLNIKELKDKKATKLSGGEKQKVSLARGLIFNPSIVLLDEPTASIDPETVEIIEKVVLDYKKLKPVTIIVVTHNLSQAIRFCDTISVLKDKEIKETTKENIYNDFIKLNNIENYFNIDYKIMGV
jgi:tungstate transport system ATP-binding protein